MIFISILIIIVSILLVLVVLIQNSKGGGIASNYASNTQVVGVKRQAEIIEKITWGLAAALFVLCIATAAFQNNSTVNAGDSVLKNAEVPASKAPANNQMPVNTPEPAAAPATEPAPSK